MHEKYGSNAAIIEHCRVVAEVAIVISERLSSLGKSVDVDSVVLGALLHDIGRTRTQTPRHGLEGAQILRDEGLGDAVVEIVKRHVGAGISDEEARALGWPEIDLTPRTLEEAIVCFSDKMVDGVRVRPFLEEEKRFVRKGHDVQRLRALKSRLGEELGEDPEFLIFSKIKAVE